MAFMTLTGYFMDSISNMVSLQLSIQEANISMKRLSEILDYEREAGMEEDLQKEKVYQDIDGIHSDICISNVTFRYGNRNPVLKM